MRFFDVHQHTYEAWETLERARTVEVARFDRDYEQRNTFSNLLSVRHRRLNLLVLNFSYHNVRQRQAGGALVPAAAFACRSLWQRRWSGTALP